jgi:CHAT domain-containing protein
VVASNWLVDDEAAASLISYYCSTIARARKEGKQPDYAAALQKAKRWIRNQEKWQSPYYWGTFVLVGPS